LAQCDLGNKSATVGVADDVRAQEEPVYRRNPRADAERVAKVLDGLPFPAAKWQILMHAENYGADAFTRVELWSLPTGEYADLDAVLSALNSADVDVSAAIPRQRSASYYPRYPAQLARPVIYRTQPHRPRPTPQVAGRVRPMR